MNPTGTCELCHTANVILIDSHIVSKWVYRRVIAYDPTQGTSPVAIDGGRAGFSARQATAYLLCRPCEDLLGTRENYVAQNGLQPDSTSFPALAQAKVIQVQGDLAIADLSACDVDKITHFAASVIWRADVGQIEPIVTLGASREPLRQYLLGGPLPANVNVVVTLLRPPPNFPRVDRMASFPGSSDDGGRHDFIACGMRFTLFTVAGAPPPMNEVSLPRTRLVLISDGRALLNTIAEEAQTSTTYGKLSIKP
jgi:hypothetical protein